MSPDGLGSQFIRQSVSLCLHGSPAAVAVVWRRGIAAGVGRTLMCSLAEGVAVEVLSQDVAVEIADGQTDVADKGNTAFIHFGDMV